MNLKSIIKSLNIVGTIFIALLDDENMDKSTKNQGCIYMVDKDRCKIVYFNSRFVNIGGHFESEIHNQILKYCCCYSYWIA